VTDENATSYDSEASGVSAMTKAGTKPIFVSPVTLANGEFAESEIRNLECKDKCPGITRFDRSFYKIWWPFVGNGRYR
jgi:hypothetical protein